jgi:glucosamine kinase
VANSEYVVGVDAGGSSTRAIAVGLDNKVLGRGTAGGANPNSHPYEVAAARMAEAMSTAISGLDAGAARSCVIGMAGSSKLTDDTVDAVFRRAWQGTGLTCAMRVVTDQEAAFASATTEPDGAVLVAGTGSIAATIIDRKLAATVGGYGWLLGDEGSAYWIGREAVRTTLRALAAADPLGPLSLAVLDEAVRERPEDTFAARRQAFARLITAANAEPPIRLARFAPLVSEHVLEDRVAEDIVLRTVDVLAEMAEAARRPGTPVVLVGSVVGPDSPIGARLRDRLGGVLSATDGVLGAAWLAAVDVLGVHARHPRVTQPGMIVGQ